MVRVSIRTSWVVNFALFEFCRNFRRQKNRNPWAIVWRCLRDPTFSSFNRTPTCDRQTDGQWC